MIKKTGKVTEAALFPVVSIHDEAIDWTKVDREKYRLERNWDEVQKGFGQEKPMIFWLRYIPSSRLLAMQDSCKRADAFTGQNVTNESMLNLACLHASLEKVDNVEIEGAPVGTWSPAKKQRMGNRDVPFLTDDELDSLDLGPVTISEIGNVALRYSFLPKRKLMGWRLPPS